jgi:hypothetical protein
MKRSGQVGLVVMGAAAFVGTYASVAAYRASSAPQSAAQTAAQACTPRPDGTQNCEPARRSFGYYLIPHFMHASSAAASTPKAQPAALAGQAPVSALNAAPPPHAAPPHAALLPAKAQPVALASAPAAAPKPPGTLTYVARPTTPAVSSSGAQRGGFGKTAQSSSSFRTSAGG